ncbi:MAG: hypothetical protein Q4Q19_04460 [Methanobrevibacter sp.]|nr:hypothetical protein [Methanobrevibacter sp.]
MVHQSKDKVFKFMFDGFPQELFYYFNVNEIFVEFLETEFIDQNGNSKVLDKLAKVLRNFLIDFEPHSSRINIQALLNFEQYQMLTRAKYNMEVKTVIISLFGHEKDFKLKNHAVFKRLTPDIIWFKDEDEKKYLKEIKCKIENKEEFSVYDAFNLILLHLMADENEEVLFEETCLLTNEAIINDDLLDLIKVCQTWFLDETVKDENRKNRIKELLKMSDYVPSILIETRKEGLEEGIKKGESIGIKKGESIGIKKGIEQEKINIITNLLKESMDIEFIQKITHYSLSDIKKAAKLASINIKI